MLDTELNLFDSRRTIKNKVRRRTKFIQFDANNNVICYSCQEYKPIKMFDYNPNNWYRNNADRRCKQCKSSARKRKLMTDKKSLSKIEHLLNLRFLGARERAKHHNIEFNIDTPYLIDLWEKQKGKCALSGIEMTHTLGEGRTPTNVSLDKIDRTKGYVKGNVQLVCMACNQIKNDLTEEEMYNFCKNIVATYESKNS